MRGKPFTHGKVWWLVIFVICAAPLLLAGLAEAADYHRPEPFMDYVPQDVGTYDTKYENVTDADCVTCHGDFTAVPHHLTGTYLANQCLVCHPGDPPLVTSSCTHASCHGIDVNPDNSWYHNSDLAASGQCNACHRPDLVAALRSGEQPCYYPTGAAPTPFRCNNCHWESTDPDPDVNQPLDVHHMGGRGVFCSFCYECHSVSPGDFSFDPNDVRLIRGCQNCHTRDSLHAIAGHQASDRCYGCHGAYVVGMPSPGPSAPAILSISPRSGSPASTVVIAGKSFGLPGPGSSVSFTPRLGDATRARTPIVIASTDPAVFAWNDSMISVQVPPAAYPSNHDLQVQTATGPSNLVLFTVTGGGTAPPAPGAPAITTINPTIGAPGVLVTLDGNNFGDRHCCGREVCIQPTGTTNAIALPVHTWTDTQITVRIPAWQFPPGLLEVWVHNETGDSGLVNFTMSHCPGPTGLALAGLNLTINGAELGSQQAQVFGDNYGYSSQVKLGTRDHTYTATNITSWSDTQIGLTLDAFTDEGGSPVSSLADGQYGVVVETTYFYDTNTNGQLDTGDDAYQVVGDAPDELLYGADFNTDIPVITEFIPNPAETRGIISIIGYNFGSRGKIKINKKIFKFSNRKIRYWSNRRVNFKLPAYTGIPSGECRNKRVRVFRRDGPGLLSKSVKKLLVVCQP